MSKVTIAVIAAVVAIIGGLLIAGSANNQDQHSTDEHGDFASVQQDVAEGAKFYDVRTPEEFASGRFEKAENWSLQQMEAGQLPDVPKDTKIYVHCQSGNRSGQATALLKQAGYTNVIDLGGLQDVQAIGGRLQV